MYLATPYGFFVVTAHMRTVHGIPSCDPDRRVLRAYRKCHLVALAERFPDRYVIDETPGHAYPFSAVIDYTALVRLIASMIGGTTYHVWKPDHVAINDPAYDHFLSHVRCGAYDMDESPPLKKAPPRKCAVRRTTRA